MITRTHRSNIAPKLIISGLTLLAFFLRAYRLEVQSFWIDEGWTDYYTHLTPGELLTAMRTFRIIPPLYHFSTIYWAGLFGNSEYALRFYALIFGVMTIPLTYRLGQALGDRRLGLLAAFLVAISPYQVWHSQDARMYTILTAASVMSMWGFIKLLPALVSFWPARAGVTPWRWWWIYFLGTELALLTHYHGLILVGIQGAFLLLTWRHHWRGYITWGLTLLLILLPSILWIAFGSRLVLNYPHWLPQTPLAESYLRSAIAYSVGEYVPRPLAILLTLAFVLLYGLGLGYALRRRWQGWGGWEMSAFWLIYTLAPNVAAWGYSLFRTPVYLERYLIPVQIGFLLAVAAGMLALYDLPIPGLRSRLTRLAASAAALLLLVGISSWVLWQHYFNPAYAKDDWRAVIRTIENFSLPGDAIVFTGDGGEKLFKYYYRGHLPIYLDFLTPVPPPDQARQIIARIAATHGRVWYSPYGVEIDATLENWLAQQAYPAWHSWLGRKRLALYAGSEVMTDRIEPVNTTFADAQGHGPTLVSLALAAKPTAAGDLLPLTLTWQTTTKLEQDYQLSLRLINGRGDIFTQSDWPPLAAAGDASTWPPGQLITDHRSLWLPPDLPPGVYALQVVVYRPDSGQGLGQPLVIPNVAIDPGQLVPPLAALSIPNPQFANDAPPQTRKASPLSLAGYALPRQIQPGQEMWLWLYWQADPGGVRFEQAPRLQISLDDGQNQAGAEMLLADSTGPLDSWQPGQVRRAVYHVRTSPRLAGSQAQVKVSLLDAAGQPLSETTLGNILLATRPRQFEPPAIGQQVNLAFDSPAKLTLLGYEAPDTVTLDNNQLPITLFWRAEAEMDIAYTVFVQLLNPAGQVVAQVDQQPLAGAAPTTTWLPGEVVTDAYTLTLPAEMPPGLYRVIAGLYDPATGQRLPVTGGGNFVELRQVTVK